MSKVAWLLGYQEVGAFLACVPTLDRQVAE